jgi:hypothetical protein
MSRAFETEDVPSEKMFRSSTRENSDYKWKSTGVIGAFEVFSQPELNLSEPLKPMLSKMQYTEKWEEAQQLWESLNLRKSFVQAAEDIPVETCCCGMITDQNETLKSMIPQLNETWVKSVNKRLEKKEFYADVYLWSWNNISGQGTTNILLIRIHELKHEEPLG